MCKYVRENVGRCFRASLLVFEGDVEYGEELEPSLDSGVVVLHFARDFQSLVLREYTELGAPKAVAEVFQRPDDAVGLQVKRSQMPFRVEQCSADVRDRFYWAVRLLFTESGADPPDEGVAIHVKWVCAVGDGVPIRENEDRRVVSSANASRTKPLYRRRQKYPFRKSAVTGQRISDKSGKHSR